MASSTSETSHSRAYLTSRTGCAPTRRALLGESGEEGGEGEGGEEGGEGAVRARAADEDEGGG